MRGSEREGWSRRDEDEVPERGSEEQRVNGSDGQVKRPEAQPAGQTLELQGVRVDPPKLRVLPTKRLRWAVESARTCRRAQA
jgi:hypothetical protein